MRKAKSSLVVLRCGNESVHRLWGITPEATFDMVLVPYQHISSDGLPSFYFQGHKWNGLFSYFSCHQFWQTYDYIWIPDDDIITSVASIERFFELCRQHSAELCAPALSPNSFFSHPITMQNKTFFFRKTSFIEVMAPCFSVSFLLRALKTFRLSRSGTGFGLDYLWPFMLDYKKCFIFDEVQIHHTRPVAANKSRSLVSQARADLDFITKRLQVPVVKKTLEGVSISGMILSDANETFLIDYIQGYRYLGDRNEGFLNRIVNDQLTSLPRLPPHHPIHFLDFHIEHAPVATACLSTNCPTLISSISKFSKYQSRFVEGNGGNDGIINGHCGFHTDDENDPWWQVDLGQLHYIKYVDVYNRLDLKKRCLRITLLVSMDGQIWNPIEDKKDNAEFGGADGFPYVFNLDKPVRARYIRLRLNGKNFFHLDQIEVFSDCNERQAFQYYLDSKRKSLHA